MTYDTSALEFSIYIKQKIEVIYYNAACLSRGNGGVKNILVLLYDGEEAKLGLI
jgi:hypothetical protein